MKNLFIATLLFMQLWAQAALPPKPNPPRLVNDFADMLSQQEVSQLEQKLRFYNDSTSTQIAVVTVINLEGYDVADYAVRLALDWGIGQKGKNNGLLFLISKDDRKVRIEAGYGLEGALTDALSSRIIRNEITPAFKNGNFYEGIDAGTDAIIKALAGEYKGDNKKSKKGGAAGATFFVVIIIIIVFVLINKNRGKGNRFGGGMSPFFPMMPSSGRGSSWGNFSGGGGSFGGFGGGSFGGGGASGSW